MSDTRSAEAARRLVERRLTGCWRTATCGNLIRVPGSTASLASRRAEGGEVLRGEIKPNTCKLFATACRPEHPLGPCMVSGEGACAAYHRYGEGSP